ncbi:MAG TPA: 30S ribosomal protein S16 [Candidatus Paceibacterota bacterium]|jgi:small subunit ribosomal protein S16|nr:30S ribosomal protein S16 [Candidatus Paceibacterota bacterium]
MISIRLTRVGKKKDTSFRVVVIDSKEKIQAGNYLEMVGSYDPRVNTADLKADRIKHWIQHGAKPSDTVHNLLISKGIIEGKKINVLPKKTVAKVEAPAEAPSQAPASAEPQKDASAEAPAEEPVANDVAAEAPADTITE